ncbi:MAG: TIGR02147 family protein [Chitinivibrionales bacterium]|nr:TIGR02147 family protein [Chitinivibrionales bacterium]
MVSRKHINMQKNIGKVGPGTFAFYSKWYHSAIWAVLTFFKFKRNYKALSKVLYPEITPDQAKSSIQLLTKLGFLKKNEQGYLEPTDRSISSGETENSPEVSEFHEQTMSLAREAMNKVPLDQREMSTMTISISDRTYKEVLNTIKACRQQLFKIARNDKTPRRVFQINFQVFPLSKGM